MAISNVSIQKSAVQVLLLASFFLFLIAGAEPGTRAQSDAIHYLPVEPIEYHPADAAGGGRRVLAPFQLCELCRCCAAGDPANCSSMPCCFGINCMLPDKPYGVCAFVPKTCNCTSCS